MTAKETAEYDRIRGGIIKVLEKHGAYEPAVDDIYVDQMATDAIYSKKLDAFLDSDTATEHTYARVIDSKVKLAKTIQNAAASLAISRRERLNNQIRTSLTAELERAIREQSGNGD